MVAAIIPRGFSVPSAKGWQEVPYRRRFETEPGIAYNDRIPLIIDLPARLEAGGGGDLKRLRSLWLLLLLLRSLSRFSVYMRRPLMRAGCRERVSYVGHVPKHLGRGGGIP